MTTPAPAEKSVDLYNRLLSLSVDEQSDEIGRILWQLRQLIRNRPGDFRAGVALAEAELTSGNREKAQEQIDRLWALRSTEDSRVYFTLIGQLIDIGSYDRAKQLLQELLGRNGYRAIPGVLSLAFVCALASGDFAWLRALREITVSLGLDDKVNDYVECLERNNFVDHFSRHQKIVRDIVAERQAGVSVYMFQDSDEVGPIAVQIYIPGTKDERRELEDQIRGALRSYYASLGLPESYHHSHLHTELFGCHEQPNPIPA